MHAFEPVEIGYDLPCCRIEDDELISIHVRDVEPATVGIEALIVKADCRPGHRNVGDLLQDFWPVLSVLWVARHRDDKRKRSQATENPRRNLIIRSHLNSRLQGEAEQPIYVQNLNSRSSCMRRGGCAATA